MELNGARSVSGVLRGYDVFMNITIADAISDGTPLGTAVLRGNLVVSVRQL